MIFFNKFSNSISKELIFRFPVTFILMFISLVLTIFENHKVFSLTITTIFLIMFIISIALHLYFERVKTSIPFKIIIYILFTLAIYLAVIPYTTSNMFFYGAIVVMFTFANFLFIKSTNQAVLKSILSILYSFTFAFIGTSILFIGFFLIIISLEYLFGFKIPSVFYKDISAILGYVLFVTLFLSNLPKNITPTIKELELEKAFIILIKNFLSPLIVIYGVILYIYFAKIVIFQELPKGNLAVIICAYLSITILLKFLMAGLKEHNTLTKFLDKYFVYFMIIPVGFLDVSIYRRVSEYGITVLRYSLIILSIWFTYIIVYQLIKKEFSIKNTLISSFLLLIVASITPYNAYDVSITSQIDRLKNILQKNNMIKDGKAIATKEHLSIKDRAQITAIVRYAIYKYDRDNQLEKLLGKRFNDTRKLLSYLNVESASRYSINHGETINISRNSRAQSFNIEGYSYASKIDAGIYQKSPWENYHYANKQFKTKLLKDLSLLINIENETIKLDFKKLVKKFIDKKITLISYDNYKDAILIKETDKIKVKFIVTHMTLLRKENHIEFYGLDGMFLFKIK